ncbi:GTPase-activating protein skywalker isoform X1 [Apis laboriosa]|uniref:TBC1 domain family member 24 isoform X1 n=2 Tax=Apis TaxID=7459 RepID=A0A7M7MG39_APIME|nr:TBC1 domain family member 24 isoform X1 [Apis mellifera]XP_012350498.1 GTPase-activating protein skywalker isoform X1 [Apis florea]XP_026295188.1 TBC1 domain family member 24 isoform X1 [Apis mellifera]XP_031776338.1 GTPase-activating protein skywalker isoform X1 [Apis florea]XP_043787919.1 GTPase-activating protein skywalker isoform X1 [Apis laboriosa]XP_043787920.1 GTPase-activating protein skywalker isoform X1 [Apis laboriosa]KAG6795658.1 TBC1 domain family member 24 isoform X1 [Apis me|eukprot:XP_006568037.1 TBC1 domain family member 24 isoform X1 [Apis mellifera]
MLVTQTPSSTDNLPNMLPVLEEEADVDVDDAFPPHVDATNIIIQPESPTSKKQALKTFNEVNALLQAGRKREAKLIIRENAWPLNNGIRTQLWPALCQQHAHGKNMLDGFYWDMVNQVFGTTELPEKSIMLPPFVDSTHCLSYHLTRKGRCVADRVVSVLGYACPDITYSPSLYPITALLLHFMPEEECYHCMASLVAAKDKMFITQTKLLYEVTWKTVEQITKKHVKSAAVHLARHCSGSRAERIYMDWMWWILQLLPFQHLVRVMDCFLHEGIKVFYRVAMAIVLLFYKHSSLQNSEWMNEISKNGIDAALSKFCRQIPVTSAKFLRTAFGIRGLSSAYISRVFLRTEMALKSKSVLTGSRSLARSRSTDNLPTSQSQVNIQMMSHTLTIREKECEDTYKDRGAHSPGPRALSMGVYPIQSICSQILDMPDLFTLWSWLPMRITMYQPILLYTTEEHGCSLTTFYVRVEQHEPTLLMIKTCNNEVFGAYCSTRWCERNMKNDKGQRQAYFGTGETFLFSLYPERAKYPWVGMDSSHNDPKVHHSAELFMAADSKMITIGGGDGQAIWMDENIRFGKTDRCSTFNNPPLCASGDFEIRVLEVYGFAGA